MKILWFANTPCGASVYLNSSIVTGGWLESLEKELKKESTIDLHVAFYWVERLNSFTFNDVTYHPIYRPGTKSKAHKFLSRLLGFKNSDSSEVLLINKLVREINPDLIHVFGSEENFGLIVLEFQQKTILTIQGILNPIYNKLYAGFPKQIINKYEPLIRKLSLNSLKYKSKSILRKSRREKIIYKNLLFCSGRTEWDQRVANILNPNIQYFRINEILRDSFYNKKWDKKEFNKRISILTIMSDTYYKGIETIVHTAILLKELNTFNFSWNIVGLTKRSNTVKIVTKWLGVDSQSLNLNLYGRMDEQQIIKLMLEADIYCQVSHIENSPNSLCEAMILGMPIVATFVGGTSTMLENNKEGILVQEGEPYSIAGAIVEISNNFSKAKALGDNARTTAAQRHSKTIIVENTKSVYHRIHAQSLDLK